MKTFYRIKIPAKLLSFIVGELADEVLIAWQRVIPVKIQKIGFDFIYPKLANAFAQFVGPPLQSSIKVL